MLQTLFVMDVQILIGIVIIHINGNVKIDAADLIDQSDEPLEVDGNIEVDGNAEQVFDLRPQKLRSALGISEIELVACPFVVEQRVARETDKIDRLAHGVKANENIGVAAAVVVIQTGDEDRIAVFLARIRGRNFTAGRLVRLVFLHGVGGVGRIDSRTWRADDKFNDRRNGDEDKKQREKYDR